MKLAPQSLTVYVGIVFNCAEIGLSHCQDHQHGTGDILVTGISVVMEPVTYWSLGFLLSWHRGHIGHWAFWCHGTGVRMVTVFPLSWHRGYNDHIIVVFVIPGSTKSLKSR